MSSVPDIQHKQAFKSETGFAFENGEPVPIVLPPDDVESASPGGLEVEQLVDLLLIGNADAEEVGQRVILLSFLLPRCPAVQLRSVNSAHDSVVPTLAPGTSLTG